MSFEPIAIIGMSCVMPGALTPEELWTNSINHVNSLSLATKERWGVEPGDYLAVEKEKLPPDQLTSITGGYVNGFEAVFDPALYLIEPEHLMKMDVMFLWLIHTAYHALKDANYIDSLSEFKINAVFGNLSYPTVSLCQLAESIWLSGQKDPIFHELLNKPDLLNRQMSGYPAHFLVKALGLNGSGYTLDAACASSLYAIKLACDELHRDKADMMLAGGVNASADMFLHIGFQGLKALSKTGESLPFSVRANGLVPAQGCGFIVLKKLQRALADGDLIHAVIRGIGLSNDGNRGGLLMPAAAGQVLAIKNAYELSGLNPKETSFIDCHATGTTLGDGIEIDSLRQIFSECEQLAIASLKSNIGHALTASGIGSVIRTVKALNNKLLPPTRVIDDMIPIIKESGFIRVLNHPEKWEASNGLIRRAGINGFGMGGNNAHVILEEWLPITPYVTSFKSEQKKQDRIAIIGIGVLTGHTSNLSEFGEVLFSNQENNASFSQFNWQKREYIDLPLVGMRFTPHDLQNTQGAQLAVLSATLEAIQQVKQFNTSRTGIIMGMQCDPSSVRIDLRWKLGQLLKTHGVDLDLDWLSKAKEKITPPVEASYVLGAMPNVMASRVNIEFDCVSASYSLSDEELSGLTALKLAMQSLHNHEIDMAIVGASDFNANELDALILPKILDKNDLLLGDMAIVLVLKRLDEAVRDKETIYAFVAENIGEQHDPLIMDQFTFQNNFGYAHAASGMLAIAASALSCHYGKKPAALITENMSNLWQYPQIKVNITSFSGKQDHLYVFSDQANTSGISITKNQYLGR